MVYKRGKCKLNPEGKCARCGKRASCGIYWYKFMWQGKLVRESTKQGSDKVARQMEAAHRTSLAKGEVGIRERKLVPTLAEFAREQFLPWAQITFAASRKTWLWYRNGIRRLLECQSIADCKLDGIAGGLVAEYVARRQFAGLEVSSINRELQVLRRLLHLAVEWGAVEHAIKIKMLSGERHRENVVLPEEEARYLAAAREPLCSIATILVDSGLRPEECFRSQWENIWFANGRHGVLFVPFGKTQAARRAIPLTPRLRTLLESRWEEQGRPKEGWVWPAPTFSGHLEPSSLKKQHGYALRMSGVRPFVLYTLRHTFLTRLGESGCDAWTLARIAGHSSIGISARYVHPSEEAMFDAMSRLGGHKSGHTTALQSKLGDNSKLLTH